MADRDVLAELVEELGMALVPLQDGLQSDDSFAQLMTELGWNLATIPPEIAALRAPLAAIATLLDGEPLDADSLPGGLQALGSAVRAVGAIAGATGLPPTVDPAEFTGEFPRQLLDYLVVEHLLGFRPRLGTLLLLLGVVRLELVPPAGLRPGFVREVIAWEDLAHVLSAPGDVFVNAYAWGQDTFDQLTFVQNAADFGDAVGLPVALDHIPPGLFAYLAQDTTQLEEIHEFVARLPLIESTFGPSTVTAGVGLYPLPGTATDKPGFAFLPYADGLHDETINVSDNVAFTFVGGVDAAGGIGILVRPDRGVDAFASLLDPPTQAVAALSLGVAVKGTDGDPVVLAGSEEGSRLEVVSASVRGGVRAASSSGIDAFVEIGLQGGRIVVEPAPDEPDGFLATMLPSDGLTADVPLLVGLSSRQGIYFGGSSGLELELPVHVQLGAIEIVSATIAVRPQQGEIPLELGATIKGGLGPLQAVVENIGLRLDLTFPPARDGNLGAANLALGFKPPNGVGLSLDVGVIKGGGYLFFSPDQGEYAGALELTVADFLSLKAIGLITTRMPDGTSGFSLLVIITAEFGSGLQLGFGFTLLGVGGLLGVNRTVKLDALVQGVRTGAIESIMFPQDVVANAPRIVSDLRAFFPPQDHTFLIGPMAKLGWGTPTLLSLEVGVVMEIPGNVAVIGVIRVALPNADEAVVLIQVAFVGVIELDKDRLYFFAALFDSRILLMPLEGEMGALLALGDDADLLVSVGGFHPAFRPPPVPFPTPKRITLAILDEDDARIRADGYFAVTTNTVQFGAHAELYFGFSSCSVQGHIGLDALLRFSPLHLTADVSASVSLKAFGVGVFSVRLDFTLEGPTPWHAHGKASVDLFFFSISAHIDVTWGEEGGLIFPLLAVLDLLESELGKRESWTAVLPPQSSLLVTLRPVDPGAETVVLHPLGSLRVSQKAVPLELDIARVGAQRPNDANRFTLGVAGGELARVADATESFAAAQFLDLDDAAKLSLPAFEPMPGGIELSVEGQSLASTHAVMRVVRYEEIVIDTNYRRFAHRFGRFPGVLFDHFLNGNAASLSPLSRRGRDEQVPFGDVVTVPGETYVVASTRDNVPVAPSFGSDAEARDDLAARIASDPRLAAELHVIPAFEAAEAA
jgi:Family of unknown function (DUF6603)